MWSSQVKCQAQKDYYAKVESNDLDNPVYGYILYRGRGFFLPLK